MGLLFSSPFKYLEKESNFGNDTIDVSQDRFAVLIAIITVEVSGEEDPTARPPVLHHGLSDGHGRPQQLVPVTQAQVGVEEVNLSSR